MDPGRQHSHLLTGTALDTTIRECFGETEPVLAALQGERINSSLVEIIQKRTEALQHLDDEMGSGDLLNTVSADVKLVANLLRNASYSEEIGQLLFRASAELCHLAGWLAFDSNRHAAAQSYWLAGLRAAHTAGNRALGVVSLARLCDQATWVGLPQDALQLAQAAQSRSKGVLSDRDGALLALFSAQAHARTGDLQSHAKALNQATELFDRGKTKVEGHAYWLDEAHVSCLVGRSFLVAGDPEQALRHLNLGLESYEGYPRDRAEYCSWLAVAYVRQRDAEQACATGDQAISLLSDQVSSLRTMSYLRDLRRELKPYQQEPCVREFTEQARELLGTGNTQES